jgi:hypothetical protein
MLGQPSQPTQTALYTHEHAATWTSVFSCGTDGDDDACRFLGVRRREASRAQRPLNGDPLTLVQPGPNSLCGREHWPAGLEQSSAFSLELLHGGLPPDVPVDRSSPGGAPLSRRSCTSGGRCRVLRQTSSTPLSLRSKPHPERPVSASPESPSSQVGQAVSRPDLIAVTRHYRGASQRNLKRSVTAAGNAGTSCVRLKPSGTTVRHYASLDGYFLI